MQRPLHLQRRKSVGSRVNTRSRGSLRRVIAAVDWRISRPQAHKHLHTLEWEPEPKAARKQWATAGQDAARLAKASCVPDRGTLRFHSTLGPLRLPPRHRQRHGKRQSPSSHLAAPAPRRAPGGLFFRWRPCHARPDSPPRAVRPPTGEARRYCPSSLCSTALRYHAQPPQRLERCRQPRRARARYAGSSSRVDTLSPAYCRRIRKLRIRRLAQSNGHDRGIHPIEACCTSTRVVARRPQLATLCPGPRTSGPDGLAYHDKYPRRDPRLGSGHHACDPRAAHTRIDGRRQPCLLCSG
jgi:hypothetical protein